MLDNLFLICFLFGFIFSAVSVLFQFGGSHHLGGHLAHGARPVATAHSAAGAHGAHVHASSVKLEKGMHVGHGGWLNGLPIFSVSSLLAFFTAFGGIGYILSHYLAASPIVSLPLASAAGIGGDLLIAVWLLALIRSEHVLDPRDFQLEGRIGEVSVRVPESGVGEVLYSLNGRRWSEAARSDPPRALAKGTKVVIVRYERGVAYVQGVDEFFSGTGIDVSEGSVGKPS